MGFEKSHQLGRFWLELDSTSLVLPKSANKSNRFMEQNQIQII
jgi:hypothetical protein